MRNIQKAVVLLSGGLDSAVTLYIARQKGYNCHCLSFDYGQRHAKELAAAKKIARSAHSQLKVVKLKFPWKGSSLVDKNGALPSGRSAAQIKKGGIPSTYVPGRNTIFMSIAASFAEVIGAEAIFIGAHSEDSSGYPDCRIEYLEAFDKVVKIGTKAGIEGRLRLEFPLIKLSKAGIIKAGRALGVPLEDTWSCYRGGKAPCMRCDSCVLRAKGFEEAGVKTPGIEVAEVFPSLQGEGIYVGARQIFVRFKGCNMDCGYCDTPDAAKGKKYSPEGLLGEIEKIGRMSGPHHSVSITGGEPLLNAPFLERFLPLLKKSGFKVYLETNGTLPEELERVIESVDIVAMDFKLPSSTGEREYWDEHERFLKIASAKKVFVKAVVTASTGKDDIARAAALIKKIDSKIPFIIQPAWPVKRADKIVAENRLREFFDTASGRGLKDARVIPQVHKVLGIK